jgi:TetR/AcrR family transcriptional repressor of uid operon
LPRATSQHTAEVRQRILEGAQRAFQRTGYRGTSISAIAREAGVSVGQVYRFFPGKQELFLGVCQDRTDLKLNELAVQLSAISDPRERLRAAIHFFVVSLVDDGWGAIIINAQAEADGNPRLRDMLIRLSDQERGFAAMFIRELIARGEAPPDLDVASASLAVALLMHGAIAHQAERGVTGFDPDAVERAIVTVLSWPLRG